MKPKDLAFLSLAAVFSTGSAAAAQSPAKPGPAFRANTIAFEFYGREALKPGNIFFSPYSMYTAFAMAYEGAKGKTAEEISSVFAFRAAPADVWAELAKLNKDLASAARDAEFKQANSFWAQQDYKFLPAYLKTLRARYGAEARQADFRTRPEEARTAINGWTEEKTKGKIKDLFPKGAINPLSRLVLVNAVYFKGKWQEPFKKEMTREANFTKADGSTITVKMMNSGGTRDAFYSENDYLQALRLPYKGGGLALLALLPKAGKNLSEVEKGLSGEKLEAIRAGLGEQKVKVFLPRFTFSSGFNLNGSLAELGMPTAFTDTADFSGMDGKKDLYVQTAVQKAFVEVNEEGTEAAAATGISMAFKSMAPDFAVFRADRPFLFFIEDPRTGLILFMGRVEDPTRQ